MGFKIATLSNQICLQLRLYEKIEKNIIFFDISHVILTSIVSNLWSIV